VVKLYTDYKKPTMYQYNGFMRDNISEVWFICLFCTETPPFIPHLQSLDDTSNFEEFEKIKHSPLLDDNRTEREFTGQNLPFVGFTYVKQAPTEG